jgi:O-antigen ligase
MPRLVDMGLCRKVATIASLLFFLLAAVFFHYAYLTAEHFQPWGAFYNDLGISLSALCLGYALIFLNVSRGESWVFRPKATVLFLLPCIPLLQYVGGLIYFSGDACLSALYLFSLASVYCLGLQFAALASARVLFHAFLVVLVSTGLFGSLVAICQWLHINPLGVWIMDIPPNGRIWGNMAQPNNFATYTSLSVCALYYWYQEKKVHTLLLLLMGLVLLFAIGLAQSRTSLLIFLLVLPWLWMHSRRQKSGVHWGVPLVLLALFFTWFFSMPEVSKLLLLQDERLMIRVPRANDARLAIWAQMLPATWQQPWLGWGWGQIMVAQMSVALNPHLAPLLAHAHNIFLDLVLMNGWPIGVALCFLLLYWLYQRLRFSYASGQHGAILAMMLAVFVHSQLELPHHYAYFLFPLAFLAGVVDFSYDKTQVRTLRHGNGLFFIHLTAMLLVLGLIFSEYKKIEQAHLKSRFESAGFVGLQKSDPTNGVLILTQLRSFIQFSESHPRENMSEAELLHAQKVAARFGARPVLFRYAMMLGLNHRYEEARQVLMKLKKLHSTEPFNEVQEAWSIMADKYPQLRQVTL